MADDYIVVGPLSQKMDNSRLTVGGFEVLRERINLSDSVDPLAHAAVLLAAPGAGVYGLVTRNIPSGTQTITGSVTVTNSIGITGLVQTELPVAVALADNAPNPVAPAVGSFLMGWDGTNWDRVLTRGNASDGLGTLAAGVLPAIGFGFLYDSLAGVWNKMRGTIASGLEVSRKNALVTAAYDFIALVQASTTDTYTYRTGGSGGPVVGVVTVTFTTSAKLVISTVAKT